MSFFDTPLIETGSPGDRESRKAASRRTFARRQQLRNFYFARLGWTAEEIADEELRLEAEIDARIAAGQVTVLPPATYRAVGSE